MKHLKKTSLLIGLILMLGLSACGVSLAQDITPPPGSALEPEPEKIEVISGVFPLSDPDAEAGKEIFIEKCAPCHGDRGLADGPNAAQLSVPVTAIGSFDVALMASPLEWFSVITNGNIENFMPPFTGSLDEQDRWDVLSYVYGLNQNQSFLAAGRLLYEDECAACHGEEGQGDGPASEDAADFTDQERMVGISGLHIVQAIAPSMGPEWHVIEGLSMDQYFSVAGYVRTFTFAPLLEDMAVAPGVEPPEAIAEEEPALEEEPVEEPVDELVLNTVSVSGMVIFEQDDELLSGLQVELEGFDHFEKNLSMTTEMSEDGSFIFEDIEITEGMILFATVEFEGAIYGSDFIELTSGMEDAEVSINIYESTHETTNLNADRMHIFFIFDEPDMVQVVQMWLISNNGDKTVTPNSQSEPILNFDLPESATNLLFENEALNGDRFIVTENGFGDLQPVLPGKANTQIIYAFDMAYDRDLSFLQDLNFPVGEVVIFIPSDGIKLSGDNILEQGVEDINGLSFSSYLVSNIGETFEIELKGSHPLNSSGTNFDLNNPQLLIGAGGTLILLIGVFLWWRNRNSQVEIYEDEYEVDDSSSILDEIVALDESFESGELKEKAYLEKREYLKEELRKTMEEED